MLCVKVKENFPSKVTLGRAVSELLKKVNIACQVCLNVRKSALPMIHVFIFIVLWRK